MKKNGTEIIIFLSLFIMLFCGTGTAIYTKLYKNKSSNKTAPASQTSTVIEETQAPGTLTVKDIRDMAIKMTNVSGVEIKEAMLQKMDEEHLVFIRNKIDELTADNWHDITGYTLKAFIDKFSTGESIDKGDNGKEFFELGFTGDINFTETGYVMTHAYYKPNLVLDCIDSTFQSEMKGVDILLINNEFPYTDRGAPLPDKRYTFHSKPGHVKYLTALGVDLVSLANNHAYDYGYESFIDTIDTLKNEGIPFVGAGMNIDEASKPVTFIINGYKVAYLASSGVESPIKTPVATENSEGIMGSYDGGILLCNKIKEAKKDSDIVIVYPHWGMENTTVLTNAQKVNSRAYIDAGADAVIGNHSHCLQGMEFYKGAPIFYSLGNFWFNTRNVYTALLKLKFTNGSLEASIVPGRQANSETHYLESASERRQVYDLIQGYEPFNKVKIDDNGVIKEA